MSTAILAVLAAIFSFFGNSSEDAASGATESMEDGGWWSSIADTASGLSGAIGKGLAEVDITDADIAKFAVEKEAGLYASIGIGDDGVVQSVGDGLSDLVEQSWFFPTVFGLGAYFLLRNT
jgi:hypothetical protein